MKIEFQKATFQEKEFSFETEGICIDGNFKKINSKLIQITSKMQGNLDMNCTRCAKQFYLQLNEDVNLRVSNGIYKENDNILEDDIIETYDEFIHFDDIFGGEIEMIRQDFHICLDCQSDDNDLEIQL
jgi:hypothetical protein